MRDYNGPNELTVGIRGWVISDGALTTERVRICMAPNGATSYAQGADVKAIPEGFEINLQRYEAGVGGPPVGPMRRIQLSFAGPARMAVQY